MSKFICVCFLFINIAFAQDNGISLDETVNKEDSADKDEVLKQLDKLNEFSNRNMEFKPFIYLERGRRNPFLKPRGEEKINEAPIKEALQGTGLEGYDVFNFELTAVIWDVKYPKALVKDSVGKIYVIEEGTKIGRSNGYVVKIREGEVVIVEPSLSTGKEKVTLYKTQVLKLGR